MDPLHLLLAAALPSAERRAATFAMEAATRRAMGASAASGWKLPLIAPEGFWRRIEQDITTVKNMKPGWRKSLNEFLMHEGPTSIAYLPSEHGMRIGETLGKITKNLPADARENLAGLVSLNPERAQQALNRYSGVMNEAQELTSKLPVGNLDAGKVENMLHTLNQAIDKAQPVITALRPAAEFAVENPIPSVLAVAGTGALTLNALQSKTASRHAHGAAAHPYAAVNAYQRGFEHAVQK
jgi:hypothetical protein